MSLDISSFFLKRKFRAPDPGNPSIRLQEHLELTRRGEFQSAYNLLAVSLKEKISVNEFVRNFKDNGLLVGHVSAYEFPDYKIEGERATVYGRIKYETGEASNVKASLRFENGYWKISSLLVWMN